MWLALDHLGLDPLAVIAAFEPCRPTGLTAARAQENLHRKLNDPSFRHDLDPLVRTWPDGYDLDFAGALISDELLARLDGGPDSNHMKGEL